MHIMHRKKIGRIVNLLHLKMKDWNTNAKNVEKNALSQQVKQLKIFQLCINFATVILITFILLFGKGVYSYEDMDSWGKTDETTIPSREPFYSELNLENITDKYYECVQKVWEVF